MPARFEHVVVQIIDGVVGEEPNVHGNAGHDSAQVRAEKCAVVESFDVRERLDVFLDQVGKFVQKNAALRGSERRPCGECSASGSDSSVDFGRSAAGNFTEERSIDGGRVRIGFARRHPLTTNEVAGVDVSTGNGNRAHATTPSWMEIGHH